MERPVAHEDLDFILDRSGGLETSLRGETILLTGATGFFGKWLTQTLLAAEDRWKLGNRLTIVTRDRAKALAASPWLKDRPEISWLESDIRTLPTTGKFSFIIHGAAAASQDLNTNHPELMFDTIIDGTKRVLAGAEAGGAKRFLFISSGAVYGPQPPAVTHVPETYAGGPDPLDSRAAYGEAKRGAEFLCASAARRAGFILSIARCHAFVGPYLPLDSHFAAGNFMRDVLKGKPLEIGGDGTPLRSYLYAADLMVWLLKLLTDGPSFRPFNIGSDEAVSIRDLAWKIHEVGCRLKPERAQLKDPVRIAKTPVPGKPPEQYVPSVDRAHAELKLATWTTLDSALEKTLRWHLEAAR